jgi:hypothetical protein
MDLDNIKTIIVDLVSGAVASVGKPTAKPEVIKHPNGLGTMALVREGYEVHEFKGPDMDVRRHVYQDLASFAGLLNRFADPHETDILLNEKEVVADLHPGETRRSVVRCSMVHHPRFQRWAAIFGKGLTQRQVFEHVISSSADFLPVKASNGETAGSEGEWLASQFLKFAAARDSNYQCEADETGTIRFQAVTDKVTVSGKLPPRFVLRVPVFQGITVEGGEAEVLHDLVVHLRVEVEPARPPVFVLSCPGLDIVRHEALLTARAFLERQLDEGFLVGLGELKTETVRAEVFADSE